MPLLRVCPKASASSRGTVLVEFMLVAPLLTLFVAGAFDLSFYFRERTVLVEAASVASRIIGVRGSTSGSDTATKAYYQEAIDGARLVVQANALNPDNYTYAVSTTNYIDGSPVFRISIDSKAGAVRYVLMPKSIAVSEAHVVNDSVASFPMGTSNVKVSYQDPTSYCSPSN